MILSINPQLLQHIHMALQEDAYDQDLTAIATIPANQIGRATIISKAHGVLSGIDVAKAVFHTVNPAFITTWFKDDGEAIAPFEPLCTLEGPLQQLLSVERTALNYMQHLSGIATETNRYVQAIEGTGCTIVDTRKTAPGMRALEKRAVQHGGGNNHRHDLASGMLIKENHIAAAGSITTAIEACRALAKMHPDTWVEVECETLEEVAEAVAAAPDIILLDNMDIATTRAARAMIPSTIITESSGGITLANLRDYAETGVDRIAIGYITHSAPALDLSMRVQ
ncbi:MAG: carboxylating nicotinate-nucleotide diphosphorylase [Zetaproteobacteria bacterium]|nr:carboxylating nicotinate-nucleotide diphosphorylase [Zetaproteobacteria bacterium]